MVQKIAGRFYGGGWASPCDNWKTLSVNKARLHSAVSSSSDSRARVPSFHTRSGHILSFLLLLIQEGKLSVTGESMCMKY